MALKIRPSPPDLDTMSEAELTAFMQRYGTVMCRDRGVWRRRKHTCSADLFPNRPASFTRAARLLLGLASLRVMYLRTNAYKYVVEFERRYQRLPKYAQWRRFFNPRAAALPGKRFRKNPPHQDRSGKWH